MDYYSLYKSCNVCPHACGVNRLAGETGICGATAQQHISSICIHKGEEPIISGEKGICNVFFSHCNLACVYCQNFQISRQKKPLEQLLTTDEVVCQIISILQKGIRLVGFVSPSHMAVQVIDIIEHLWEKGYKPVTVWNSNAYDNIETLKLLEPYMDVYLPDFKYSDDLIAQEYSHIKNYSSVAIKALKEMYYQKGNTLRLNNAGEIEKGLIVRHLVLPNHTKNSLHALELLAEEISPRMAVSLMAQYYPPEGLTLPHTLQQKLTANEYQKVVDKMNELGFTKGWIQEFESNDFYRPDFNRKNPFEEC
jgi:putative pyruvate formate lyase activating enzyme